MYGSFTKLTERAPVGKNLGCFRNRETGLAATQFFSRGSPRTYLPPFSKHHAIEPGGKENSRCCKYCCASNPALPRQQNQEF